MHSPKSPSRFTTGLFPKCQDIWLQEWYTIMFLPKHKLVLVLLFWEESTDMFYVVAFKCKTWALSKISTTGLGGWQIQGKKEAVGSKEVWSPEHIRNHSSRASLCWSTFSMQTRPWVQCPEPYWCMPVTRTPRRQLWEDSWSWLTSSLATVGHQAQWDTLTQKINNNKVNIDQ